MNLEPSAEQAQLRDSLARLLTAESGFEVRRHVNASDEGFSRDLWARFAQLGLTALAVPVAHGGLAGSAADLAVVMEELGAALVQEPMLASAILACTAISVSGDGPAGEELLPQLAAGTAIGAWAHDEAGARHAPLWVETRARLDGGVWFLDGTKAHVLHGAAARFGVVSARVAGTADAPEGLGLFVVDVGAPGLVQRHYRLLDGSPAAIWTLAGARARALGVPGDAYAAIAQTRNTGIAALCADAVGAARAAFALTVAYLNTRKQFGRLLGENQALRHRVADMHVALEACRSAATLAALALDDPDSCDPVRDLSRAKLLIGRHGRFVCQQAIQLHGGIGMTEEYAVGHYLRRLTVIDQLFGDADAHLAILATMPAQVESPVQTTNVT